MLRRVHLVLGNPPWERIKLQEQEFFASREAAIAEAPNAAARGRLLRELENGLAGTRERLLFEEFQLTKRVAEASSVFSRLDAKDGGRFPLTGRGDINTYALFAEHFLSLSSKRGRAGIIVPTGLITDYTNRFFFAEILCSGRLIRSLAFDNQRRIFPSIHPDTPFTLLTLGRAQEHPEFAAYLLTEQDMGHPERYYRLSPEEITQINPNTKTAPVFRSRRDAQLTAKIYNRVPVLVADATAQDGDPWSFDYMTKMFDMADSSDEFLTRDQFAGQPLRLSGNTWVDSSENALFLPLYEAKMIHQFDHRWATFDGDEIRNSSPTEKADSAYEPQPRYWVAKARAQERIGTKGWRYSWLMGWRDVTNATNERTVIASFYPAVAVGHTIRNMFVSASPTEAAAFMAGLGSLPLDYVARQKLGGTHLTVELLKQLPALPPAAYSATDLAFLSERVLELSYTSYTMRDFAQALGYEGPPFPWDEHRRAVLRAEIDAWHARAYGLTRDELRYILEPAEVMGSGYPSETFRSLKETEIKVFREYRTRRLVLEAWDRMEQGELPCPEPYDRSRAATSSPTIEPTRNGHSSSGQSQLEFAEEPTH